MSGGTQTALERGFGWCGRPVSPGSFASPGRVGAVSSGAEGASSSLEERAHNGKSVESGPHYAVKLKDFGEGRVCAIGVYREKSPYRGKRKKTQRQLGEQPLNSGERFETVLRRSRRILRDKVWMLRSDRMLTLTKRGRFVDLDEAWFAWDLFRRLARKFWGPRFTFVVVPESHKAGGFHLHVALVGYFDVGMLRRLWYRALGGTGHESGSSTPGNVDITGAVSSPRSRVRIASYLAKYLGKNVGAVLRGRRSVASSRGIPAPRVVRWVQAVELGRGSVGRAMRQIRNVVDARLVGLGWWEWNCGLLHGFGISPLE